MTYALAESQDHVTATFVVATLLQTRAPTGKFFGPAAGLLLSSPTTFHVIGVAVRLGLVPPSRRRGAAAATESIATIRAHTKSGAWRILVDFSLKFPVLKACNYEYSPRTEEVSGLGPP